MKTKAPTPPQLAVLQAVHDYNAHHRLNPTYRDVVKRVGISYSNVQFRVKALLQKGLLTNEPGVARSLALTAEGERAIKEAASGRAA